MKEFFVVVDGFAVPAINQRGRERSQTRQTHQVFRERRKTPRRIDRVGRLDRLELDARAMGVERHPVELARRLLGPARRAGNAHPRRRLAALMCCGVHS